MVKAHFWKMSLIVYLAMSIHVFGQTRIRQSGSLGKMTPVAGPDSNTDAMPNSTQNSAGQEQIIQRTAQQLAFTSDQLSQLDSFLEGRKSEGVAADKGLRDARSALANAITNGSTSFDSEIDALALATARWQATNLKLWEGLYAIATPDQEKQLLALQTPLSQATNSGPPLQSQ